MEMTMKERANSWFWLALGAVALVAVDAGVSQAQPMRQGREIARKIVLCDTQEQAKEILEMHAMEGFAAGAVTYFKWKRTMNEENQPSCDQGVWRFKPLRRVARFDQLEFGDEKGDRFLVQIEIDGESAYAIVDEDVTSTEI
jgi:hypothetical protein